MIKEGDILIINDEEYIIVRKINKPYAITKLKRLNDDDIQVIPTVHLIKKLQENN